MTDFEKAKVHAYKKLQELHDAYCAPGQSNEENWKVYEEHLNKWGGTLIGDYEKSQERIDSLERNLHITNESWKKLKKQNDQMRQAMMTAYNNAASHPKVSVKPFLLNTFKDFWEPELVEKINALDGERA